MSDDAVRAHVHVTGRVQAVSYRAGAAEAARRLALTGWVRNRLDGSVEAVAEGPRATVEEFVAWCHDGPAHARVEGVHAEWAAATGEFAAFEVRR